MVNKVENIEAKGEIAHHEQIQVWPQYFQKSSAAIASKWVFSWERVFVLLWLPSPGSDEGCQTPTWLTFFQTFDKSHYDKRHPQMG